MHFGIEKSASKLRERLVTVMLVTVLKHWLNDYVGVFPRYVIDYFNDKNGQQQKLSPT